MKGMTFLSLIKPFATSNSRIFASSTLSVASSYAALTVSTAIFCHSGKELATKIRTLFGFLGSKVFSVFTFLPFAAFCSILISDNSASRIVLIVPRMYCAASMMVGSTGAEGVGQRANWMDLGSLRMPVQMCSAKWGAMGVTRSAAVRIQ